MPTDRPIHPAALPDDDLLGRCELTRGRTSGPGGQHRNKVETLVVLTHRPTGIAGRAGERRSAEVNRKVALRRLRLALAVGLRVGVPVGEARSELWRTRCRGGRIACNPHHHDYPALLAEALDMLEACKGDPRRAAVRLDCSMSQLVRLIRHHPPALAMVNDQRAVRGEHALR